MPQPIHPLLDRLRHSEARSIQDTLRDVSVQTQVIQEFQPLVTSLEWELSDLFWATEGARPFATNRVPFIVNNSGRLSENAAACLYSNCLEADSLEDRIAVLELGAGSGLFARYFLDAFQAICAQEDRDFYGRLTYFVSDQSPRTAEQWRDQEVFAKHDGHVVVGTCDSTCPAEFRDLQGENAGPGVPRAVFANYALDVLPAAILRRGAGGPEQLCVRTRLTSDRALLGQYTQLSPEEIQARANGGSLAERAELLSLLPLLEFETAYHPVASRDLPPHCAEALEFGGDLEKL
ncbi:MAG: SAM-dependent methyltransferase, partial [Gammaproteobacteria bacterium]